MPLGSGYHIVPLGDLVEHEFRPDCVCGPDVSHQPDADNPKQIDLYFRHHALDGRETPGVGDAA